MFYFDFSHQIQSFLNQYWLGINIALIVLLMFLGYVASKNILSAQRIVIVLFPWYLVRTKFFSIPTTYLELAFLVVFGVWLIQLLLHKSHSSTVLPFKIPLALFVCASILSLIVAPKLIPALGLWKAYFIEPVLWFIMLVNTVKSEKNKKSVLLYLLFSAVPIVVLALFQGFTGWGIAESSWVVESQRRVTAFFTSPNAVGLYIGPILVFGLTSIIEDIKKRANVFKYLFHVLMCLAMMTALAYTKSEGAWLGVTTAMIVYAFFRLSKVWTSAVVILAAIAVLAVPVWKNRSYELVTFSDRAGQNRIQLWSETARYLLSSPQHFIFGAGILGFSELHKQFRNPNLTEPLLYPHNILLNFWMETGILGLLAFLWIVFWLYKKGFQNSHGMAYPLMAAITAILVHGSIDVPYMKNDLAMLFWTLAALIP